MGEHPGSEQHGGLHTRRKSVLPGMRTRYTTSVEIDYTHPVDPSVLQDLQAHRSLDSGRLS